MPRAKVSYKTKRKFHGNKFTSRATISSTSTTTSEKSTPPKKVVSSSSKKLSFTKYDNYETSGTGNCIFDVSLLSDMINQFVKCKFCDNEDCIELSTYDEGKQGLAVKTELKCNVCYESIEFYNSNLCDTKKYDVNLKIFYAMRSIGKGLSAANIFCALMDLPSPPQKFEPYNKILGPAIYHCAEESMKLATQDAVRENSSDCKTDLAICLVGSWQRRGHTSLNGFVSVISFDTGKVLDVAVMSKYCQTCVVSKDKNIPVHDCTQNYTGSSGGMEAAGALTVFENSVRRGVRYVKYLGDGDSNGFKKVTDGKPYGNGIVIKKLECVGHVKKRMGTRLRKLKRESKGIPLDDGKVLGGRKRLTDVQIDKLQEYYGLAINRAGSDLEAMKRNVWATYFHMASTDENPHHGLCPQGPDSWCKYNKSKALNQPYIHKTNLPVAVMNAVKGIYRDLADPELLKKCLHGRTQNANESFNSVVWSKIPKNTFVRLNTLKLGVYDAVLSFNDGFYSKLDIYKKLGLTFCRRSVLALKEFDRVRVRKADKAAKNMTKEARTVRRLKRKALEDEYEAVEESAYGAGMF